MFGLLCLSVFSIHASITYHILAKYAVALMGALLLLTIPLSLPLLVRANWRITFEFVDCDAYILNLEDYH